MHYGGKHSSLCFSNPPLLLVSVTLYTASSPLSHQQSFLFFFIPSTYLCPCPVSFCFLLFMSLIIFLPLSLACFVQPSGPSGVCFTPSFYAESCHMHVWTCQGGVLKWCWHMHISLLCSGHRHRRGPGTEWRGEVNLGQWRTRRCKNENKL